MSQNYPVTRSHGVNSPHLKTQKMENIEVQIERKLKEKQDIERVKRHLQKVEMRLLSERAELNTLDEELDDDYTDLDKLNKISLRGMFYKVLGSKEEQLEKEKQEYLQKVLKFNDLKKSIELLTFEQKVLSEKLRNATNVDYELKKLLKKRWDLFIQTGDERANELQEITDKLDENKRVLREILEAMSAGDVAKELLINMKNLMGRARDWGNWDLLTSKGSGMLTSYLKHSNLDKARSLTYKAKYHLQLFRDELHDVYEFSDADFVRLEASFNLDAFTHFTDIFFDNLISDWIVQRRIRNGLSNIQTVIDKVRRLLMSLDAEKMTIEKENAQLIEEKTKLLMF